MCVHACQVGTDPLNRQYSGTQSALFIQEKSDSLSWKYYWFRALCNHNFSEYVTPRCSYGKHMIKQQEQAFHLSCGTKKEEKHSPRCIIVVILQKSLGVLSFSYCGQKVS